MAGDGSSIPDFQTLMLPVLRAAASGEISVGQVVSKLADEFILSDAQRSQLLPSGRQSTFSNRVQWAKSYLLKAGLIEATKRAHFRASRRGLEVLENPPARIDIPYLRRWPEFVEFRAKGPITKTIADPVAESLTPDENMRRAYNEINESLADELLQKIHAAPPAFFEALAVKLLVAMGYGGSIEDAGRALGKSGDGGVDGVIDQDELGLDRIYVQAKLFKAGSPVGPAAIRDFFGALDQFKANKGMFVTTSTFSQSAVQTAAGLSKRIVLIDGARLARLMIQHDVGCRVVEQMSIRKIDEEFFEI